MSSSEERQWARVLKTDSEWVLTMGSRLWSEDDVILGDVVRRAVNGLSPRFRDAVALRIWGRYTFQEIADEMGWPSRQYAFSYYKRGLDKLRLVLGDELYG